MHMTLSPDAAHLAREKAHADAELYKAKLQAEANKVIHLISRLG